MNVPERCTDGGWHDWREVVFAGGFQGSRCGVCGVGTATVEYPVTVKIPSKGAR